jgi:putative membrane protein insertion efficiency factor
MQALNWKIPVKALAGSVSKFFTYLLLAPIQLYRWCITPVLGSRCRFYPSCSKYAQTAIKCHGPVKGSGLAIKRICRCHPYSQGGIDFVPGSEEEQQYLREQAEKQKETTRETHD